MGKITNIQKEKELIGCFLLSRDAINIAIDYNFIPNEAVDKFNQQIFNAILEESRINSDYIPTINTILDALKIIDKEELEKARIKLNRYKNMIKREIINEEQIIDISKNNILILRDLYIKRKAVHILKDSLESIDLPARDFISNINKKLIEIEINDGEVTEISIFTGFKEIKEEMEYMRDNDIDFGYKFYLRDMDKLIQENIAKGTHSMILGRPSNYKTGLALNIAYNQASNNIPTAIFSHEMSPKNVYRRILARVTGITMNELKKPKELTSDQWQKLDEAIKHVESIPLFVIDGSKLHIGQIDSVIAYLKSKYNIEIVWFDYYQLIRKRDGSIPTEERDFAEISEELRMFPKKYDIAVISLSQANRSCESRDDKRPTMKDIRNSGKAEQDAENIFYVYRDEFYYGSKSEVPNHIEVGALKMREGELRRVILSFNGAKATLGDADPFILLDKGPDYIGGGHLGE